MLKVGNIIYFQLAEIESNISSTTFNITDFVRRNGNDGKYCSLTISLNHMSNIVIEEIKTTLHCAIDRVIIKASQNVTHKLYIGRKSERKQNY